MIRISTDQTNPLMIRPVGSTVTLTCMADLDPAIDVPVTVNIQLRDPAGSPLTTTTPSVSGSTYSSMATISSFGRDQSGLYNCTVIVSPSSSNSFLSNSSSRSAILRVTTGEIKSCSRIINVKMVTCLYIHTKIGVYLSLEETVYTNNSVFSITEIGTTSNTGLQCITDRMPCCSTSPDRAGEWYFSNRIRVPVLGTVKDNNKATTFYRNRGDDGTVNLNRVSTNVFMPTGLFCCEVPDALNVMQRACANIKSNNCENRFS